MRKEKGDNILKIQGNVFIDIKYFFKKLKKI